MGKHSDLEALKKDIVELHALKERLLKLYGPGPSKEAIYNVDREIGRTINKIAAIEMRVLQHKEISVH